MTATLRDSRTVPSLAELRARKPIEARPKKSAAYVRCFDLQPYQESVADQLGAERDAAGARLALAAKAVRP